MLIQAWMWLSAYMLALEHLKCPTSLLPAARRLTTHGWANTPSSITNCNACAKHDTFGRPASHKPAPKFEPLFLTMQTNLLSIFQDCKQDAINLAMFSPVWEPLNSLDCKTKDFLLKSKQMQWAVKLSMESWTTDDHTSVVQLKKSCCLKNPTTFSFICWYISGMITSAK